MNYEDKYKSALGWIRSIYPTMQGAEKEDAEHYFPELRESEDERIRRELIERFKWELKGAEEQDAAGCSRQKDITMFNRGIAWLEKQGEIIDEYEDKLDRCACESFDKGYKAALEKQGEQKSSWSEEDENGLGDALWAIQQARTIAKDENDMGNLWYAELWLKSLKDRVQPQPKQEWSEEDEEMIDAIIADIQFTQRARTHDVDQVIYEREIDWLIKSIKERYTWKPSEEHFRALFYAIEYFKKKKNDTKYLESLYNDLKKL